MISVVGVSGMNSLECFDTVDWVTRGSQAHKNPFHNFFHLPPKGSLFGTGGARKPSFTWKVPVTMEVERSQSSNFREPVWVQGCKRISVEVSK